MYIEGHSEEAQGWSGRYQASRLSCDQYNQKSFKL